MSSSPMSHNFPRSKFIERLQESRRGVPRLAVPSSHKTMWSAHVRHSADRPPGNHVATSYRPLHCAHSESLILHRARKAQPVAQWTKDLPYSGRVGNQIWCQIHRNEQKRTEGRMVYENQPEWPNPSYRRQDWREKCTGLWVRGNHVEIYLLTQHLC